VAPLLRAEHRLTLALVSLLVLLAFLIIDMIVANGARTGVVVWLAPLARSSSSPTSPSPCASSVSDPPCKASN